MQHSFLTDPLLCGQKSLTASPRSSRRNTDEASVPHKTSITHQLETDIPGSPLQIPRICLTRKSKNSRSILKTGFVGHWSRNLAFGKKKKKSSRFPSDQVVPSPKTMSTLIQENLRVVAMAARLSFFSGCWSQDCLVSLTEWREYMFQRNLKQISNIPAASNLY